MSKIWQNYDIEKQYIVDVNPGSPYVEIYNSRGKVVKVNPLLRFSKIFLPLCQKNTNLSEKKSQIIQNCLFHYLVHIDRLQGTTIHSFQEEMIEQDISCGKYGEKVKSCYECLTVYERTVLLAAMLAHQENPFYNRSIYRLTLQRFFPGARVFYYQKEDTFLVYLPYDKNEQREKKVILLQLLFLDWVLKVRLFWQWHYGVIGDKLTMRIGNIAIY